MDPDKHSADSNQSPNDGDEPEGNTSFRTTVKTGPVAKGGKVIGTKIVASVIRAAINLPAWAWVTGIVIISIALVLAVFVSNPDPILNRIPTPSALPTQLAFAPATENETLIIVADFEDRSDGSLPTMDPAQDIYDRLEQQIRADQLDIRVRRLSQPVNDNTAPSVLETYDAYLLIWGWYDSLSIKPRLERSETIHEIVIDQEGKALSLTDSNKTILDVKTADLPNLTQYLVMLILGMDKHQNSELQDAKHFFENAIEQTGDSVDPSQAYFSLGQIAFDATNPGRDIDDAIELFGKAIDHKSDYASAYNNRGLAFFLKGDYSLAVQDYTAAIQQEPENYQALTNRAAVLTALGEYNLAMEDVNEAIKLEPENPLSFESRGDIYLELGEMELAKKDYETAMESYKRAAQSDPNNFYPYTRMGIINKQLGNNADSILNFTKAIDLNGDDPRLYLLRGFRYSDNGDHDLAIADFEEVLEDNQFSGIAHQQIANQYFFKALSDPSFIDPALDHMDEAVRLNSDDASMYLFRAYLLVAMDEIDPNPVYIEKAKQDLLKTIEIATNPGYKAQAEAELKRLEGQ